MKYSRLSKEQFEELHQEFINFLSAQQIDKNEWDLIKLQRPEVAEQELDVFSDLIWEKVLSKARYLEHFSQKHIFLFECNDVFLSTIVINTNEEINFFTSEGLSWLGDNLFTDKVIIQKGRKVFTAERNEEIFDIVKQGAIFSNGDLFKKLYPLLEDNH